MAVLTDFGRDFTRVVSSAGKRTLVAGAALLALLVEAVAVQLRDFVARNSRQAVQAVCVLQK